jgi:hypothetical protein
MPYLAGLSGGVKPNAVAGCISHGSSSSGGGSLLAEHYTRDVEKALPIAERLEKARLKPNVVPVGSYYSI